jgi:hypothetical protein
MVNITNSRTGLGSFAAITTAGLGFNKSSTSNLTIWGNEKSKNTPQQGGQL